jgi:hypothetical protein
MCIVPRDTRSQTIGHEVHTCPRLGPMHVWDTRMLQLVLALRLVPHMKAGGVDSAPNASLCRFHGRTKRANLARYRKQRRARTS